MFRPNLGEISGLGGLSVTGRFELATIDVQGQATACLFMDNAYLPIAALAAKLGVAALPVTLMDMMADWPGSLAKLKALAARAPEARDLAIPAAGATIRTPLLYPGKVLCAGANYFKHLAEMGMPDAKKENQRLFFFFKPPRQALVGPGRTVHMPRDTKALDWEVELAAVIGKTATAVSVESALSHVAAWSVGLDLSARDLNRAPETFYKLDWVAGKAQDTCGPLGPHLVPAEFVGDPHRLRLQLAVNGETKQDDTTADMVFDVAEQISILSRIMTLEPGDVLFTGTPAGVGAPKQTFMKVGDRIDAEIESVGKLWVEIGPAR